MPYCHECGNKYTFGDEKCLNCGTSLPIIQDQSDSTDPTNYFSPPTIKRAIAGAIDYLIALALFLLLFLSKKFILLLILKRGFALVIPHLYLLFKDSIEGKSIGKMLLGILVFNEKEKKPGGILDSIIRNWYLAFPIFGPTILVIIVGTQILIGKQKRVGDERAGTIVITDSEYQRIS
jgi:uncharacterized RDD family membrane protein YckC